MSVIPELRPDLDSATDSSRFRTIIYNNETNSMDEVVIAIMMATDCPADEAYMEMWEAHHFGKADIHFASEDECKHVASVVGSIGVKTEVRPEWES